MTTGKVFCMSFPYAKSCPYRCLRKAEAEGSNPFISTMQTSRAALLACAFFIREQRGRNFGYIASLGYIVNLFGIRYVRALSSSL